MITFKLDFDSWDLQLDGSGDIAIADGDLAIAETCANAIRLFTGEAYFDQKRGIPHFDIELGQDYMSSNIVFQSRVKKACLNVDGVSDCDLVLTKNDRTLGGDISIATENGATINLEI